MQHSPPLITAIELAAAGGQVEALQVALHTFKSSTANLGGLRLATLTKECERLVFPCSGQSLCWPLADIPWPPADVCF